MAEYSLLFFQTNNVVQNSTATQSTNNPDGLIIFILAGILILSFIFFIYYYLNPKSRQNKLFRPRDVLNLKLEHIKNKAEYKLSIKNKSTDFIEIKAPELILKGLNFSKKMKAKSDNYPLTISPGNSHSIIIRKRQLIPNSNKKVNLKLFRIFIYDRDNNVFKSNRKFL